MEKMPRSKDRSRSELEKLREMNSKEKLEYIRNYYSYYIIGGLIAVVFIISILSTCLNRPDIGLSIEWSAPYIAQDDYDLITNELNERLFNDMSNVIVQGSIFFGMSDDPSIAMGQMERLMAMIAAGAVDIFILDDTVLEEYAKLEYIYPLEDALNELRVNDRLVYDRLIDETYYALYGFEALAGSEKPMGIRITDSPLLSRLSISLYDDAYLCICITSSNYDNAKQAIIEFFS